MAVGKPQMRHPAAGLGVFLDIVRTFVGCEIPLKAGGFKRDFLASLDAGDQAFRVASLGVAMADKHLAFER